MALYSLKMLDKNAEQYLGQTKKAFVEFGSIHKVKTSKNYIKVLQIIY
jgi:hypothetical protein